jgi:hypothetical protein
MARRLRHIEKDGSLVEITNRTVQARYLLRPDRAGELNEIVLGVVGRAQRLYDVRLCGLTYLSNHGHILGFFEDARQMALFMNFVNGEIGREVARFADWPDKVWARRYVSIPVSDEPEAQIARLRYLLANSVKENLVERADQWPGVHSVGALRDGKVLKGLWFDRTAEYEAKRRRESFARDEYATEEVVELSPLPCMEHLSPEEHRAWVADLVKGIEEEAAASRGKTGKVLGAAKIYAQDSHHRPDKPKRSPAPDFHAASKQAYDGLRAVYAWVVQLYREATDRLRDGDRTVKFPEGTFPPGLPFVPYAILPRGDPA